VVVPSLSQVESASFGYLTTAGAYWRTVGERLLAGFTEVRNETLSPGGSIWRGTAAQAAQHRAAADVATVADPCEQLLTAAGIATRGREQLEAHRNGVLEAVDDAIHDDFIVNDDYSITDTRDYYSEEEFEQRQAAAQGHASFIGHRVMGLVAADREIATALDASTEGLDDVAFDESEGTVQLAGWGRPLSPAPPTPADQSAFEDLLRANDQAVLDAMARVRAAQRAFDDATANAYSHGAGSGEAQDAMARLPALKKNLADALDELGKIPDYSTIDPASVRLGPDGLSFTRTVDGQTVQVGGPFKNGTGEIFDQGSGAYYTYRDGQLVGARILDPGRVTPDDALLQNVIFTAVGAGPAVTAGKAGVEAGWQGMRALFAREGLEASGGAAAGLTADNVLPRAIAQAEIRAHAAADDLATHHPGIHTPTAAGGDHIPPAITQDHVPHGGPHAPPPAAEIRPAPSDSPLFEGYHPVEPGPQFTDSAGHLIYPNDSLASKPYAIPGTVIPEADLAAGTELGRFGHPGGAYLAPDGTPFAQLSLPPGSAAKPYYTYVVDDPAALPRGWHIEESRAAPWFHQPGGGIQYRVIAPPGKEASVDVLIESGYLKEVRR